MFFFFFLDLTNVMNEILCNLHLCQLVYQMFLQTDIYS